MIGQYGIAETKKLQNLLIVETTILNNIYKFETTAIESTEIDALCGNMTYKIK